jgi:uncharacterized protein (UPF0212 family)
MMADFDHDWRHSGARRVPRPTRVEPCAGCGEALGTNYPGCPTCHDTIEAIWLADWAALLEREGIQSGTADEMLLAEVVMQETERHPFTVVDIAMSLLRCGECGSELGSHYPDCGVCGIAFGASIMSEFGATSNEHALHIGRWILRNPGQNSANILTAWRLTYPRVLVGWLPTTDEAQRWMAKIKEGGIDQARAVMARVDAEINARSSES